MELSLNKEEQTNLIRLVDPVADSNCYVILGKKTCIVIDPNNFKLLEQVFQKWDRKPSVVLLTHGHCDHISGLNELRSHYKVTVVATSACSEEMQNARANMSRMMEMFLYYKSGETKLTSYAPFVCKEADLHFTDTMTLSFEGKSIRMKALPGHTHGSGVICYEDMIFCGDYLLPNEQVVTRLPGGSEEEYERDTKPWLMGIPDGTMICPGHGKPYQMSEEVRSRHDLR